MQAGIQLLQASWLHKAGAFVDGAVFLAAAQTSPAVARKSNAPTIRNPILRYDFWTITSSFLPPASETTTDLVCAFMNGGNVRQSHSLRSALALKEGP
jgi:hypothetical protein